MALKRVWMPTTCYSTGTKKRLIVLHTAEGARDYVSLGKYFQNAANKVSSQVGIDDTRGTIGEYVRRENGAWTQASYNSVSIAAELCAFAAWSKDEWMNKHRAMLENCAEWIREESAISGIPIVKLSASQAQGTGRGVCQHRDLGAGGGNHSDCGNGFPMDTVIEWAKSGSTPAPTESEEMATSAAYWYDPNTDKSSLYMACVGKADSRVYYAGPDSQYKWIMVDPNSKAASGLGIAAAKNGELTIVYTSTSGAVVTYTRASGGGGWVWKDRGGQAK